MIVIIRLLEGLLTGVALVLVGALCVKWFAGTDYYKALTIGALFVLLGVYSAGGAILEAWEAA